MEQECSGVLMGNYQQVDPAARQEAEGLPPAMQPSSDDGGKAEEQVQGSPESEPQPSEAAATGGGEEAAAEVAGEVAASEEAAASAAADAVAAAPEEPQVAEEVAEATPAAAEQADADAPPQAAGVEAAPLEASEQADAVQPQLPVPAEAPAGGGEPDAVQPPAAEAPEAAAQADAQQPAADADAPEPGGQADAAAVEAPGGQADAQAVAASEAGQVEAAAPAAAAEAAVGEAAPAEAASQAEAEASEVAVGATEAAPEAAEPSTTEPVAAGATEPAAALEEEARAEAREGLAEPREEAAPAEAREAPAEAREEPVEAREEAPAEAAEAAAAAPKASVPAAEVGAGLQAVQEEERSRPEPEASSLAPQVAAPPAAQVLPPPVGSSPFMLSPPPRPSSSVGDKSPHKLVVIEELSGGIRAPPPTPAKVPGSGASGSRHHLGQSADDDQLADQADDDTSNLLGTGQRGGAGTLGRQPPSFQGIGHLMSNDGVDSASDIEDVLNPGLPGHRMQPRPAAGPAGAPSTTEQAQAAPAQWPPKQPEHPGTAAPKRAPAPPGAGVGPLQAPSPAAAVPSTAAPAGANQHPEAPRRPSIEEEIDKCMLRLDAFFADEQVWQHVANEVATHPRLRASMEWLQALVPPRRAKFRVQVPSPYPGIQYRKSKALDDRYPRYAKDGMIVEGNIDETGAWLQVSETVYLPTKVGDHDVLKLEDPGNGVTGAPVPRVAGAGGGRLAPAEAVPPPAGVSSGRPSPPSPPASRADGLGKDSSDSLQAMVANQGNAVVTEEQQAMLLNSLAPLAAKEGAEAEVEGLPGEKVPEARLRSLSHLDEASRMLSSSEPINPFVDTPPQCASPSGSPRKGRNIGESKAPLDNPFGDTPPGGSSPRRPHQDDITGLSTEQAAS